MRYLHSFLPVLVLLFHLPALATPIADAASAFARQDFAGVLKHLPNAPDQPEAKLLRATALLRLRRHTEAAELLEGLASSLPELRDLVLFRRAEALGGSGRHAQAAAGYREAARSKGSRFIYLSFQRRAEELLADKQWNAAMQEFNHLLRTQAHSSHRPEWELSLALCEEKLGKHLKAATRLRDLWLTWPASSTAPRARRELDRLLAERRLRLPPLPLGRRLARIRLLRKEKLYPEALTELRELRKKRTGEEVASIDVETALMYIWANRPADALGVLQSLPVKNRVLPAWHRRALIAACLARTGKVKEAAQLLLKESYHESGHMRPHQRAEVARAALLLAEHGRYTEALKLRLRLASFSRKLIQENRLELGWLSYRAGQYTEALRHLEIWSKRAKPDDGFALYWLARSHARAGQAGQAETIYREIVEKHPQSYYGLLARSRLVEAGKLKLGTGRCAPPPTSKPPATRHAEVLTSLASLEARFGEWLPELRRAHILWRLGMTAEAHRELRLLAIHVAWVAARGRPREWIQRPSVERLWRGGPLESRRWDKTAKALASAGAPLRHAVGALLEAAGISYFGWRFSLPDTDMERRRNPRVYPELVFGVAQRFQLDPNLIWAIMRTESSYRLDVISKVGATGLMQIMPHTARRIAAAMKLHDFEHDQLFEPETNLQMAAWYLKGLSTKFHGQTQLVAAGYNGGPHHVARWLEARGKACDMDEFVEEIPFSESRRYAKKVLRLVYLYERLYCSKTDRLAGNKLDPLFTPEPDF